MALRAERKLKVKLGNTKIWGEKKSRQRKAREGPRETHVLGQALPSFSLWFSAEPRTQSLFMQSLSYTYTKSLPGSRARCPAPRGTDLGQVVLVSPANEKFFRPKSISS